MPPPTTLMPWISTRLAAGLAAAISRSGAGPLLAMVRKPPACEDVVDDGRAHGSPISMSPDTDDGGQLWVRDGTTSAR